MRVSQQDIADKLSLSRTTVTKILNRDPNYSAAEKTRNLVFKTAEELGYDFSTIRRPFKRQHGRKGAGVEANLVILLKSGEVFDEGEGLVKDISAGGARLAQVSMHRGVLPLKPFTLTLRVKGISDLKDIICECQVVRLGELDQDEKPELGVKFVNITNRDRVRIQQYVSTHQ